MKHGRHPPQIPQGLEVSQISFSGGRTAASMAHHGGLTHIDYYGSQRLGDVGLYKGDAISSWAQVFRPVVQVDGKSYTLDLNDTCIYPFGYSSHAVLGALRLAHGMYLLNDALVFTLDVVANPDGQSVAFALIHADACVGVRKPFRTWRKFAIEHAAEVALAMVSDRYSEEFLNEEKKRGHPTLAQRDTKFIPETSESETWVGVTASSALGMRETPPVFRKYYFQTEVESGRAAMVLAFGHKGRVAIMDRLQVLRTAARAEVESLIARHNQGLASQPRVQTGRPVLDSLLANAGAILNSFKVSDIPGGMRAADSGYWIWGWDNLVHPVALGLVHDTRFMVEMLDFHQRTADPELGIAHAFSLDERNIKSMKFPAQCLYAIHLYHTYLFTGDRELLVRYLPFARWIADAAGLAEVRDTGLLKGVSPYPDHPEDLEQDGNDLCAFNNSIYYQALKCLAALCQEMGDTAAAADFETRAARTRTGFDRFFDKEKVFFVDSLSSIDFTPRKHYPLYAILWVSSFAADLVTEHQAELGRFAGEHFPARHGLRILPTWDTRYMYDGNQLGMYMPVIENFCRELMKTARHGDGLRAALDDMEWFWRELCIPEALTCEYENHGLTMDNPGRKQLFCLKAWLAQFYTISAGLQLSLKGLSFSVADVGDISIYGLVVRGKSLDIDIRGRGWTVGSLKLNGRAREPNATISFDDLTEHNTIEIDRV